MKKIIKTDILESMTAYDFFDFKTLNDIEEHIKALKEKYKIYNKVYFYSNYEYESVTITLKGEREETDEEFEKRKAKIALDEENARKSKEKTKAKEYETYLKLKENYGKKIDKS